MSRKIKFHAFHFLFRLFAYLADKSGGWRVFVRPKLLLGSLIVGLGLSGSLQIDAQSQTKKEPTVSRTYKGVQKHSENELTEPVKNKTFEEDHIYTVVEQMPKFPRGEQKLFEFIAKNITQPPIVQCYNGDIQGRVICRFVVEKDGSLSNITVLRSLDPTCDKEAVRVLKLLPKFTPAKHNGKAVRIYYTLPVHFSLL